MTVRKKCYTATKAYVHVFMAYLKFINREFLWDPLSLLLVLRLMQVCEFADFTRDNTLNACEELVYFDFVSLFTKIPVDLAVKVAEERLREDASIGQRTSLPVENIIHLLSFCLKTPQFAYKGIYYHPSIQFTLEREKDRHLPSLVFF